MGCVTTSAAGTPDGERSYREFQLAASLRDEGQTAGAIEHLRKALQLDPENAEAHLLLGFIQMERRTYQNAEAHLATAIELLEKQQRGGSTLAEARNIYGLCLIELGRYDEAVVVLRESASDELNTAPHLAWGNLGLAQFHLAEYQETVTSAMEAVRIQPRFCVGYYTMARAFWRLQQLKDAERALVGALEADPSCSKSVELQGAWRLRGEVRARLGHRRDAVADLERCVELDPYSNDGRMCQTLLEDAR
ncbi:MAG: tetratricopeptide repeat protein [Deltaproteobacteria bacterium]|nr:tetratricopeptide repeat protein [Deltaproteobacteria bacterium]NND29126.1 tetratricopeptide repeat protein [Myxococcales bacterium]MBT8463463.1 tetratricopeptide repeat protein [Deltaproteobacteria bacterium]MBT8481259.1 tetratricopeptide repeat protein [Deltaproteobacteria bacterium]NNK08559.1 tetratricopeptide repeat protein [Myxococcales bacterium]